MAAPAGVVPDGWRAVKVDYRSSFGTAASATAPSGSIYIYYGLFVDNQDGLLVFEIIARVLYAENTRGLLPRDTKYRSEVAEHWPQDQVAPGYIIYRNAARSGQTVAEHVGPNRTADPALEPANGTASDNAHIIALGVDEGWLLDPSYGADWYYHQDKNTSYDRGPYLDDTLVGDWAAGTYWQPGYSLSRTIYPLGYSSSRNSPYP